MRRLLGVMAFAGLSAGLVAAPVGAQDHPGFDIPVNTVVPEDPSDRPGEEGSVHLLATKPVAEEDVGRGCNVVADGENNSSVHLGTDLLVRSGDSEVVLEDVEREPNVITEADGTLTLDTEVSVSVRLGPDGIFSGGLVVSLDCPIPPSPPTESSTTTTVAPPTTAPPEAPPPPAAPAEPVAAEPDFVG